jgi:hypothetical protein
MVKAISETSGLIPNIVYITELALEMEIGEYRRMKSLQSPSLLALNL